jgi:hypothetical protein
LNNRLLVSPLPSEGDGGGFHLLKVGMGLLFAIKHRKICKYKIKIISCTPKPKNNT